MTKFLALCVYRCMVGSETTESIDIQCRYFLATSEESVLQTIESEPPNSYLNDQGEIVTWPLVDVLSVDELSEPSSGQEVTGGIRGIREMSQWADTYFKPSSQGG